jgi:trk system potassium uptake protein
MMRVIVVGGAGRFQIPRIVARVNDPANEALFDWSWGVDALVSPATALASMIRAVAGRDTAAQTVLASRD